MDSLFALKGKDFVLVVSESTVLHSIFKLRHDYDKSYNLDTHQLISLSGSPADNSFFGNFITRNVQFLKFKNQKSLTVKETANFVRNELAKALRKSPYQVSSVLSGWDKINGAQLYWFDYLGTMQELNHCSHGYSSYFVSSIFGSMWKENLELKEALQLVKYCIAQLRQRFLISQDGWIIKVVDSNGVRTLNSQEVEQ